MIINRQILCDKYPKSGLAACSAFVKAANLWIGLSQVRDVNESQTPVEGDLSCCYCQNFDPTHFYSALRNQRVGHLGTFQEKDMLLSFKNRVRGFSAVPLLAGLGPHLAGAQR